MRIIRIINIKVYDDDDDDYGGDEDGDDEDGDDEDDDDYDVIFDNYDNDDTILLLYRATKTESFLLININNIINSVCNTFGMFDLF